MTVALTRVLSNNHSKYNLLFIHGFMAGPSSLDPLVPELSRLLEERLSLTAVTLPGHSGQPPSSASLSQYADSLANSLNSMAEEGRGAVVVYGYSMGGRIALQALCSPLLRKDAVAGAIFESSSWGLAEESARQQRLAKDRRLLAGVQDEASFRRFLTAWYRLPLFRGLSDSPRFAPLLAERLSQNPAHLQAAIDQFSVGHQRDLSGELIDLPMAKLYICGEWDTAYRANIEALMQRRQRRHRIPSRGDITLKVIEGASHNCHGMAPVATAAAIHEFLEKNALFT